jgi:thioredoxin-like negative regulator of GroEL
MQQIKEEAQFRSVINGAVPVVAVFKAVWCKDCHYIEPFMPDLIQQYEGRLAFVHVDRDDLPDLCAELNILGIPSFIVFREGQEITRFVSKLRKTREEIEEFLDRSLQVADALGKS